MKYQKMPLLLIGIIFLVSYCLSAQQLPSGFSNVKIGNLTGGASAMKVAQDGRIFVCLQNGTVRVFKNGQLLTTPFTTISVDDAGERGLLGVTTDPDFVTNGYVYFYFTLPDGSKNRLIRLTAMGDVAQPGSEQVILDFDNLTTARTHNGGGLQFGADGKLYVAIGENGFGGNSQSTLTYRGKVLRINKDGSVPEGNPFTDGTEQRKRIWAYGLRNPFTISVQPGTSRLFINDVGGQNWEEINDATTGGLNFGWPVQEGVVQGTQFNNPVYAYGHGESDSVGCAIAGGDFFTPRITNYPPTYYGAYFFMELCNSWINFVRPDSVKYIRHSFATDIGPQPLGLQTGPDGCLYFITRTNEGAVYRLQWNNSGPPQVTQAPHDRIVANGSDIKFEVSASGSLPLNFQWMKDGSPIVGATLPDLNLLNVSSADIAHYSVSVSNELRTVTSNAALLSIEGINLPPTAAIITPAEGFKYKVGSLLSFSGTGSDPEDGLLPDSLFTWQLFFHGDGATHEFDPIKGVRTGEILIGTEGGENQAASYELCLTVADKAGVTSVQCLEYSPATSIITVNTVPQALTVTIDGELVVAPATFSSIVGMTHTFDIESPQVAEGKVYNFISWKDNSASQTIVKTPESDSTLTATFEEVPVTGVVQNGKEMIAVYPNPASRQLIIENAPSGRVEMSDELGRRLYSFNNLEAKRRLVIDICVDPGVYFLRIIGDRDCSVHRILIKSACD